MSDHGNSRAGRATLSLPRFDATTSARLLRLQADEALATMLTLGNGVSDGGVLTVPSRELVGHGAEVRVEISFGPLADEITLRGLVESTTPRDERAPLVAIRIDRHHAARVRYVHEVLCNDRHASARAYRRVSADTQATWHWGLGSHATHLSDISKGGAFIRSGAPPSTGSAIGLSLDDNVVGHSYDRPLALDATVAWVGRSQGRRGFGVKFRVADRTLAGRIAALVRWHERAAGLTD